MRRAIPIVTGVILFLVGIGWAFQGAGMIGGSSLMDNNSPFIYLGDAVASVGVLLIIFGVFTKPTGKRPTKVRTQG
jgi:xanthine/uracil permease